MYIIPAAGLTYTVHTCTMSHESFIVLDKDYHCHHEVEVAEGENCCGTSCEHPDVKEDDPSCCTNQNRYFKEKDEYTIPGNISLYGFKILLTTFALPQEPQDSRGQNTRKKYHPPPVVFTPKDILLKNSSLLI